MSALRRFVRPLFSKRPAFQPCQRIAQGLGLRVPSPTPLVWSQVRLNHHHHACGDHDHDVHVATVQKPAPKFKLRAVVNGEFKEVSLSDYKGRYVVLFFYPLDFTFVCPTEITAFSDRVQEFRNIGCEVLAASIDSEFTHLAWIKTPRTSGGLGNLNIPLIADVTKQLSRAYGVLIEEEGVALRGLFIIDGKGIVRQITINDLPVGRSVDETLRLVKAFQFTDKHGEVCPADWAPGKATMFADPEKSQAFFQKQGKGHK